MDRRNCVSIQQVTDEIKRWRGYLDEDMIERINTRMNMLSPVTPKPVMTEEVREALMRLSMCARGECTICKYENSCGFGKQVEMATENMNIILNAFDTAPTERTGEWIEHKYAEEYDGLMQSNFECSKCHDWLREQTNYCPTCGARMKGQRNE